MSKFALAIFLFSCCSNTIASLVEVSFAGEMIYSDGQPAVLAEFGLTGVGVGDSYVAEFSLDDSIGVNNSGYAPYWLDGGWAFDLPQSTSQLAPQLEVDFGANGATSGLEGYTFMLLGNDVVNATLASGEVFSGDAWWLERGGPRDAATTNRSLGFMFLDYDGDMLSSNDFYVPTSTAGWDKIEVWFGTWDLPNTTWTVNAQGSSSVPIPASAWLFGTALIGLLRFSRAG